VIGSWLDIEELEKTSPRELAFRLTAFGFHCLFFSDLLSPSFSVFSLISLGEVAYFPRRLFFSPFISLTKRANFLQLLSCRYHKNSRNNEVRFVFGLVDMMMMMMIYMPVNDGIHRPLRLPPGVVLEFAKVEPNKWLHSQVARESA
jgi:hypothetical protein